MATVLRVRRKRSSDPSEALIFSCKKARTAGEGSGRGSGPAGASGGKSAGDGVEVKTVFKFAGTVAKKDQPISQRIQAALSTVHLYANLESPKPQAKPKPTSTAASSSSSSSSSKSSKTKKSKSKSKSKSDSKSKSRASQLAAQQEGRFQIVSTLRGVILKELDGQSAPSSVSNGVSRSNGSSATASGKELFSLFDAVVEDESKSSSSSKKSSSNSDSITCNSVQMIREKLVIDDGADSEFVYDLYYADDNQLDFGQSIVTGMQLEDEELIHNFFDEGQHETYDDEDDSNDENNWRNDYPDEDPDKRHEDLFDEYHDEYRYGDVSSDDDDILNDYSDYRKRPAKNLDYFSGGRDPLDDLM